jgi:hypothetical protein
MDQTKEESTMSDVRSPVMSRRRLLMTAGTAAAGVAALGRFPKAASAHDLTPTDPQYHFAEYEAIVNRDVKFRQLWQWREIVNPIINFNIANALNAAEFSYGVPAGQFQVVVQAYHAANNALYDDHLWAKYRLGEAFGVMDPAMSKPAIRNIFYKSPLASPPAQLGVRADPYYADSSIEGLQRRGVLYLVCHNSVHGHALQAVAGGRNPDNQTAAEIVGEIVAHLVPGSIMIPAGVFELVRLQDKGYRLAVAL